MLNILNFRNTKSVLQNQIKKTSDEAFDKMMYIIDNPNLPEDEIFYARLEYELALAELEMMQLQLADFTNT